MGWGSPGLGSGGLLHGLGGKLHGLFGPLYRSDGIDTISEAHHGLGEGSSKAWKSGENVTVLVYMCKTSFAFHL